MNMKSKFSMMSIEGEMMKRWNVAFLLKHVG